MHKVTHHSISKKQQLKYTLIRDWVSKIWSIHIMENYAIVKKKNEEIVHLLYEKRKRQNSVYGVLFAQNKVKK